MRFQGRAPRREPVVLLREVCFLSQLPLLDTCLLRVCCAPCMRFPRLPPYWSLSLWPLFYLVPPVGRGDSPPTIISPARAATQQKSPNISACWWDPPSVVGTSEICELGLERHGFRSLFGASWVRPLHSLGLGFLICIMVSKDHTSSRGDSRAWSWRPCPLGPFCRAAVSPARYHSASNLISTQQPVAPQASH